TGSPVTDRRGITLAIALRTANGTLSVAGSACMKWTLLKSALIAYWDRHREDAPAPKRSHIDPIEIPRLLPYVGLVDVEDNGAGFRFRLVGQHIVDNHGRNIAGDRIEPQGAAPGSIDCPLIGQLYPVFRDAVQKPGIQSLITTYDNAQGRRTRISLVALPLFTAPGEIGMLFGGALLEPR
ncbi:MAG: PAS domain-containing protein, partial [Alphaproteobacteria bacterium]|nr:PAS domain-containing protein [Alphaproteobacteria bacterium]